ncbi:MAG: prepilin-type N-terminal cleavage/methylation domain-containing protein [Gallionella sp.]
MKSTIPANLKQQNQIGFTLIEMTVVLFIVALLLGGMVPTLSSQIEQRQLTETRTQLDTIRDALIGYTIINGRMPCPASAASNGIESPVGGGNCTNENDGFVPAVTLGLSGASATGYIEDAWGSPLRYAVSTWGPGATNDVFTTTNGIRDAGISNLIPDDLIVCSTASANPGDCSVANSDLSPNTAAVIYSIGRNWAIGGTSTDETENPNPSSVDTDSVFVSHTPSASSAPNGEFDDILIWISPNILVNRMVSAGVLP